MLEHADHLEQLAQHAPHHQPVILHLNDHVFLRSSTWARLQLGVPLRH